MLRAAPFVALVVLIVGLVAGCTGHESARPTPSSTPTLPAPMPSPPKPASWSDNGERGADAAAVWFTRDLQSYVLETNDVTAWKSLSHPDCVFCNRTIDDANVGISSGTVLRGGLTTVTVTRTQELNPLAYSVLVDFDQNGPQVYRLDGTLVETLPASHGQMLLVLHREGPDWQLREGQWFEHGASVPTATVAP